MNSPIEVDCLEAYINCIGDLAKSEKSHLYRGLEDAEWEAKSSVLRRLEGIYTGRKDLLPYVCWGYLLQIVDEIQLEYPSAYRSLSPLECLAHLQHNGVATGLIDFTFNPLVALWFACASEKKETNGKVIVLENDPENIESIRTTEELESGLGHFFNATMAKWRLWAPALDTQVVDTQRITRQYSVFLFGLHKIDSEMLVREIVVPYAQKVEMRTELAKVGISEQTLFADPPGFWERNTAQKPYDFDRLHPYYGETLP